MRRFSPDDPVTAVFDYATTQLGDDEAANGFDLVAAGSGEGLLSRQTETVATAGLGGLLLRLRWRD